MIMPGVLQSLGATASQRAALFYGVCIWVRLAMAYGVYRFLRIYPRPTILVVLVVAVMATMYNGYNALYSTNDVWWCRGCHAVVAAVIAVLAVLAYLNIVPHVVLPWAMVADVLFGVAYSRYMTPFS